MTSLPTNKVRFIVEISRRLAALPNHTSSVQSCLRLVVGVVRRTSHVHLECSWRDEYELPAIKVENKVAWRQWTDNDALSLSETPRPHLQFKRWIQLIQEQIPVGHCNEFNWSKNRSLWDNAMNSIDPRTDPCGTLQWIQLIQEQIPVGQCNEINWSKNRSLWDTAMNSIDPRTDPCGTTQWITLRSDWTPLTPINWVLSVRYERNHESEISVTKNRLWSTSSRMPWSTVWSTSSLMPWSTVSNASLRSSRPRGTTSRSSSDRWYRAWRLQQQTQYCAKGKGKSEHL